MSLANESHNADIEVFMTKEISYFQFQKELGYPVFVRFEEKDLEFKCESMLTKMGFSKLGEEEFKQIEIVNDKTRILNIQGASIKVAKQIDQAGAFDSYGPESVREFGTYDVYRYKGVGMIMCGHNSTLWEAGIKSIEKNPLEVKTLVVRYLSLALAPFGVISFWGVPVNEGFVIMKAGEANFETVFVDIDNNCFITQDGIQDISFDTQILRLDESLKGRVKGMSKEELVSFLSVKTCYLSGRGLDPRIKDSIFELANTVEGFIYPVENFKPRNGADAA